MASKSLANMVVDALVDDIFAGKLAAGDAIPPEGEIAQANDVSRATVREALKTLQAGNVVVIRRGIGTFVNPPQSWTSLEFTLKFASRSETQAEVFVHLIEVRRMVETGAAALAAQHRTDDDIKQLEGYLGDMEAAADRNDVTALVEADIAFHDVVFRASGNIFVSVIFAPLSRLLYEGRTQTGTVPLIQRNAIAKHREVLESIRARDAEGARLAMNRHMDQTVEDLKTYVLPAGVGQPIGA